MPHPSGAGAEFVAELAELADEGDYEVKVFEDDKEARATKPHSHRGQVGCQLADTSGILALLLDVWVAWARLG